jgi:hypothetical protein
MKNAVLWGVAPCRCGRLNRLFGGSYRPEDGGDTILRNVGSIDHIYTAPHPRRRHSSSRNINCNWNSLTMAWETDIKGGYKFQDIL